jgi:hypothetical protein
MTWKQILLTSTIVLFCKTGYSKIPFDYSLYNDQTERKCTKARCLTLNEVVNLSKRQNYATKNSLQKLIQVQHKTRIKLARLVPSISISTGVSASVADFSTVTSLVGFLFPSNWFSWKESKLFYLAEKESYLDIIVKQILLGQELYLILHKEMIEAEIFKHHYKTMDNIIEYFKGQQLILNKISDYDISRIETVDAQAKIKALILLNEFKDSLPLLAHMLALPIEEDWDNSSIEFIKLPQLDTFYKKDATAKYKKVLENSCVLKSLKILLMASDYTKKKRIFEFLAPGSGQDASLGLGYLNRIEITNSGKKTIENKIEETKSSLKVAIHALILDYNTSLDTYTQSMKGREAAKLQLKTVFDRYKKENIINFEELSEALRSALNFDLERNNAQHYYFISKLKIENILLQGKDYEDLEKYVPNNKKLNLIKNWYQRKENRILKKQEKKIEKNINEIFSKK